MSTVKHFYNQLPGAPVLTGQVGTLVALLDACLVNGFGLKTLDSLTVSGGIATGTVSTGHSFEPDTIAEIAGATPSGLNGQKRILTVAGNSFTFDATGISNQTATGTITCRLAPAGWSKPFSGTNVGVYRSNNVTGTRMFLRVDDNGVARNAFFRGFENMIDAIGTGQASFPLTAQIAGQGLQVGKSNTLDATARNWLLVADDRTFYLWTSASNGTNGGTFMFGDFSPLKAGDSFACVISGANADFTQTSPQAQTIDLSYSNTGAALGTMFAPRSFSGVGGSIGLAQRGEAYWNTAGYSAATNNALATYPNPTDNALLLNRVLLIESSVPTLRGTQRGLLHSPQVCQAFFDNRVKIDGRGAYAGRKLMFIASNGGHLSAKSAGVFFDITGPWD